MPYEEAPPLLFFRVLPPPTCRFELAYAAADMLAELLLISPRVITLLSAAMLFRDAYADIRAGCMMSICRYADYAACQLPRIRRHTMLSVARYGVIESERRERVDDAFAADAAAVAACLFRRHVDVIFVTPATVACWSLDCCHFDAEDYLR